MIGWTPMSEWYFHVLNMEDGLTPISLTGNILSEFFYGNKLIFGDTDSTKQAENTIRAINWTKHGFPDEDTIRFLRDNNTHPIENKPKFFPYYYMNRKSLFDFLKSNRAIPSIWETSTNEYPTDEAEWGSLGLEYANGLVNENALLFVTSQLEIRNDAAFNQVEFHEWDVPLTWINGFGIELAADGPSPASRRSSSTSPHPVPERLIELIGSHWIRPERETQHTIARLIQNIWLPNWKIKTIEDTISDKCVDMLRDPTQAIKRHKAKNRKKT